MMSFNINSIGCNDDREFGAGLRLMKLLAEREAVNTAIFVVRLFGGTLLGPKRLVYIENAPKEALDALQLELEN